MVPAAKILETAREREGRHHRPVRPDHAVARRDVPRRRRDGARGLRPAAADRRRDDQPRPHRGEDRPELPARPDGHVTDASRAVGVASSLLVAEQGRRYRRRRPRRVRARSPTAHARGEADKRRISLAEARANRFAHRLGGLHAAAADLPRHARVRRLSDRRARPLHRLDAVLRDLGARRARIRCILDDAKVGAAARALFDDAQAMLRQIVDENWLTRQRRRRLLAGECRRRRHRASMPTRRARRAARDAAHAAPAARRGATAAPTWRSPISSRRATSGLADYIGGFAVTAGIGEEAVAERFERANDDYSDDPGQGAGRPPGRGLRRAAARARAHASSGATRRTRRSRSDELIARDLSRHPPGARLSGAARPHREGDAVRAARRRGGDRHQADRELRHVAGLVGLRALFRPSRQPLFRRRPGSSATRSRTTPRRKGWTRRRGRALARADPQLRAGGAGADGRRIVSCGSKSTVMRCLDIVCM